MSRLTRALVRIVLVAVLVVVLLVGGGFALILVHYGHDLPDYQDLATYVPPTGTRLYAGDGSFMAEYAAERRTVVPIEAIPPLVIHAFLTAEDREYYVHPGINPLAIVRAALSDVVRYGQGLRLLGASTITQQVVKHFLLNNRMSWSRKVKEAILAYRIDHYLTKNRVLELYLNEIYLGAGAYGVAEAAETYFQKPLDQLTIPEAAFLAALPKAPNNYNPARFPAAATDRRNWVIEGMAEQGYITAEDARAAIAAPLGVTIASAQLPAADGFFAEAVRRELIARFGQKLVYGGGLTVRTSYVPVYQAMAERAFRDGLVAYDRRHGWRGPIAHLADGGAAEAMLATIAEPPGIGSWQLAAVTSLDAGGATIALKYGSIGRIPLDAMRWARRTLGNQLLGPPVRRASDVVVPGDIVLVAPRAGHAYERRGFDEPLYGLEQIPNVSGGMAVMDPKTGRVFALVGGWSFRDSQFDRATQAWRQPGSAIKPFVYVTALEHGFTPSSVIEDAPIALSQGPGLPMWRPVNYEGTWVGPTTLRQALVHSRNLATARLASMIGMPTIGATVDDFGVMDKMPLYYSMALGAGDTTLLRLTSAYAMLDDGGQRLLPSLIDLVRDRNGRILYQKGTGGCGDCYVSTQMQPVPANGTPYRAAGPPDGASIYGPDAQFAPDATVYQPTGPNALVGPIADSQIVSMMQGVVQQGTGIKVAAVGKPLAGKTGTTSNFFDGWFVGFSPDLVAGVYVGFDEPRTLGNGEAGGIVAAPIFRDFMAAALHDAPSLPFPLPSGANLVTVNSITGQPTDAGSPDAIVEAFRPGTAPQSAAPDATAMAGDGDTDADTDTAEQASTPQGIPASAGPSVGTGGLY